MKACHIIMLFLLAGMKKDKPGMLSCGESMTGGNPLRWNSQEVTKHIVFVFHQVGSVAEWRYMKRQSKP